MTLFIIKKIKNVIFGVLKLYILYIPQLISEGNVVLDMEVDTMMTIFRIIVLPIYISLLLLVLLFGIPFFFIDKDVYNGRFIVPFIQGIKGESNGEGD